jgi:glycerol uptake facilitator-like aquaporin
MSFSRKIVFEAVGTALLLAAIVGSGIMAERLASGNLAIALMAKTLSTGAALVALILTFGPISGAHFNPAVTMADASQGGLPWKEVPGYIAAQVFGAFAVVAAANAMRATAVPFAVGAYITAAYWFTASTSFANPAVTLARSASDTFAGIRLADAPGFIAAQLAGAAAATGLFRWLIPSLPRRSPAVLVPHTAENRGTTG